MAVWLITPPGPARPFHLHSLQVKNNTLTWDPLPQKERRPSFRFSIPPLLSHLKPSSLLQIGDRLEHFVMLVGDLVVELLQLADRLLDLSELEIYKTRVSQSPFHLRYSKRKKNVIIRMLRDTLG